MAIAKAANRGRSTGANKETQQAQMVLRLKPVPMLILSDAIKDMPKPKMRTSAQLPPTANKMARQQEKPLHCKLLRTSIIRAVKQTILTDN